MTRSGKWKSRLFRGAAALAALLIGSTLLSPAPASAWTPILPIYIPPIQATVWANLPTTTQYQASNGYTNNSTGGAVTIRRTGVGAYTVTLEKAGSTTASVTHVVAYGSNPVFCTVAASYPLIIIGQTGSNQVIMVRCFDFKGEPVDSQFVATYTNATYIPRGRLVYLTTDQAVPTEERTLPNTVSYDSAGSPIKYERITTGRYKVKFGPNNATGPIVPAMMYHVTAAGSAAVHCQLVEFVWEVWCSNYNGQLVDSRFSMTWGQVVDIVGNTGRVRFSMSDFESRNIQPDGSWFGLSTGHFSSDPDYYWNGVDGQVLGTGRYKFTIRRMATPYGTAFVSPKTTDVYHRGYCVLVSWMPYGPDEIVWVNCYRYGNFPPTAESRANLDVDLSFTTWPAT